MQNKSAFLKRLAMLFSSATILMFFSEFFFVNEEPSFGFLTLLAENPGELLPALLGLIWWYMLFAAVFLTAVGLFRVRNFWSLFLAAALYGWAAEGVSIQIMYEDLPTSIAWTSLGWHALLDAIVGLYVVRKVLHSANTLKIGLLAAALGLFWGIWATWYWPFAEYAPMEPVQFALFAFFFGTLWIAANILLDKAGGTTFKPSIIEVGLLIFLNVWFFVNWTLLATGTTIALFVLPPLVAITLFALWRNKQVETREDIFSLFNGRILPKNYAILLLTPVIAVAIYTLLFVFQISIPIAQLIIIPVVLAAFLLLILAWAKTIFGSK